MYSKVLVALDLSDETEDILNRAKQMLKEGSIVHLCTAVLPLEYMYSYSPVGGYAVAVTGFQNEIIENSKTSIKSLAEKCGFEEENAHVLIGKAGSEVHKLAEEVGVDLIIVGSHGKGAIRSMLGSTSRSIVNGAPCDVLTVPYKAK